MIIRNRREILSGLSGKELRAYELVLDALEAALASVEPQTLIRRRLRVSGDRLLVDGLSYDLSRFRRIYVIGGGKATGAMAVELNHILGNRVDGGVVNVPHGTASSFQTGCIEVNEASHPVPDKNGVEGVRRMLSLIKDVDQRDLVICLISGGGSALLPLPTDGVSLEDIQSLTQGLLKSGAPVDEINSVRKHLSNIKGGWLARRLYPATVLGLTISDVVGDRLATIASGPITPDPTTYQGAVNVLKTRRLWKGVPNHVRRLLLDGVLGKIEETPKPGDPVFDRVASVVVGGGRIACEAAFESMRQAGLDATILTNSVEGEAREVGSFLAKKALEISRSGLPVQRPAAVVVGGETTVTVRGDGVGGRNQEVALGFALKAVGLKDAAFASIDTDGLDGSSDAAGAVVDGGTADLGREEGLDPTVFLERNDVHSYFSKIGGLVVTGPTSTNVNDVAVLVML